MILVDITTACKVVNIVGLVLLDLFVVCRIEDLVWIRGLFLEHSGQSVVQKVEYLEGKMIDHPGVCLDQLVDPLVQMVEEGIPCLVWKVRQLELLAFLQRMVFEVLRLDLKGLVRKVLLGRLVLVLALHLGSLQVLGMVLQLGNHLMVLEMVLRWDSR